MLSKSRQKTFSNSIDTLVLLNYDNDNPSFANGICNTCNRVLLLNGKSYVGTTPRSLQIHPLAASGEFSPS